MRSSTANITAIILAGYATAACTGPAYTPTRPESAESICYFAYTFFENPASYITGAEWADINSGIYHGTEQPAYIVYEKNGISISYLRKPDYPEIWRVALASERIPKYLRDKKDMLTRLAIQADESIAQQDQLHLGCDGIDLNIKFDGNITVGIEAIMDEGII